MPALHAIIVAILTVIVTALLVASLIVLQAKPITIAQNDSATAMVSHGTRSGSGVLYGGEYIITAKHLVDTEQPAPIIVQFRNGNKHRAKVVASTDHDLMILKLDKRLTDTNSITLSCRTPKIGTSLYTIGQPDGLQRMVTFGHMSLLSFKELEHLPIYIGNMQAFSGNSGGGVFEEDTGLFAGIVSAIMFWPNGNVIRGWPAPVTLIITPEEICDFLVYNNIELNK